MAALIPDERCVVLASSTFFLANQSTTGYTLYQCCHLQSDLSPLVSLPLPWAAAVEWPPSCGHRPPEGWCWSGCGRWSGARPRPGTSWATSASPASRTPPSRGIGSDEGGPELKKHGLRDSEGLDSIQQLIYWIRSNRQGNWFNGFNGIG